MKRRLAFSLPLPVLVGIAAYWAAKGEFLLPESPTSVLHPVIDYPSELDLGDHELGEHAVAHFTLSNQGTSDLVVDRTRTNCSCTGLEREVNGRYERLDSVELKPGERRELVIRVSVRGTPIGAPLRNVVEFRTNDPNQPTGHIEVLVRRVMGGVFTDPPALVFGSARVGSGVRRILDVWDASVVPRAISQVISTSPDTVTVRVLAGAAMQPPASQQSGAILIGQLDVLIDTAVAAEVSATLQIQLANEERRPDTVTVAGRVVDAVEMSPSVLVLPRQTSRGLVHKANVLCRSTEGNPLTLTIESLPPGMTAEIRSQEDSAKRVIAVAWDERQEISQRGMRQHIRLRARVGGEQVVIDYPVIIRP